MMTLGKVGMMDPPPERFELANPELAPLLRATASGERAALAEVYRRTSAKLYGIVLRILRSENDAQEVLQDVYVTVWEKAGRFDPARASAITWLSVLARNRAIDRLRRRRPSEPIDAASEIAADQPSSLDLLEAQQDQRRLAACLEELETDKRDLIRTAFIEGTTYAELAKQRAVPLGTVKSWIRRSLLRLKGCLER